MAAGLIGGTALPTLARNHAYSLEVESRDLRLERWNANGFRIAAITDLHMNSPQETERAIEAARLAIAARPDVILLGGDYVDLKHPTIIANIRTLVAEFADCACPVAAIMGNHDYWSTVPRKVIEEFRQSRVNMLLNETLEVDGVTIAGLDDAIQRQQRYDFFPKGTVSQSLVALFHEPDFVKDMPEHVSLQVSGHSHGGQVCLPFGKSMYTPFGARKYIAGFYPDARVPLFVSRGVGTTGPDYRLFCAPEVSVLTLRSA